jgi:glycosyltransferase involved in cell wall biosynthesis
MAPPASGPAGGLGGATVTSARPDPSATAGGAVDVVYVVRSWPRWSQGFVLHEVLELEARGLRLGLFALVDPHENLVQAGVADVRAPVRHFDAPRSRRQVVGDHAAALRASPRGYVRAAWLAARRRAWDRGYHVAGRGECFDLAVRVSRALREQEGHADAGGSARAARRHVHAHFAHDPAAVVHLTHLLTGCTWSFTGHARDLLQIEPAVLVERVGSAEFVVTCCGANVDHLAGVLPPPLVDRVHLVHHGVDSGRFVPRPAEARDPMAPVVIVSAGRLVEKKGFEDLIDACDVVHRRGRRFRCVVYGDGPLQAPLEARIDRLGLGDAVELAGVVARTELAERLRHADVFALTPCVTDDGDRDGIPNVMLEAMACGLPVVATAVAGIPEVVDDGVSGVLAPVHDVAAIADHLTALIDDPDRRATLGAAARDRVVTQFDAGRSAEALLALFASLPVAR